MQTAVTPTIVNSTGVAFVDQTAPTTGTPAGTLVPQYNIHLLYHAIDLHFEYMANARQQDLNFIQDQYTVDADGFVAIGGGLMQKLSVEKAEAQKPSGVNPTVWANCPDSIWKALVYYPGTSARLEQTPAGQYWHVLETATIKIAPIVPDVGSIA